MRSNGKRFALWCLFGSLWTLVFATAMLMSRSLIQLEKAEREARHAAAVEENLRLALWRLDSILGPLLAQQSLQQVQVNPPLHQIDAPWSQKASTSLSDIPLLVPFQILYEQNDSTPKASLSFQTHETLNRLHEFRRFRSQVLPDIEPNRDEDASLVNEVMNQQRLSRSASELSQRAQNLERANQNALNNSYVPQIAGMGMMPIEPPEPLTAFWDNDKLLLARQSQSGEVVLEGWEIDWPALQREMQQQIGDLLPNAAFQAVKNLKTQGSPDMLVSIPCMLVPGTIAGNFQDTVSDKVLPLAYVLLALWLGVVTAAVATGILLAGALRLSDRRAEFVAAVTHELRTPLTTLQLYSEMLGSGMIESEETKQSYLQTLQHEVQRIVHLVENVFAYARLEKGRRPRKLKRLTLHQIVEHSGMRLHELAERAKMQLVVEANDAWDTEIMGDFSMLEQIVVNLIDNAGKYANEASDRRIFLQATRRDNTVRISVEDRGAGFAHLKSRHHPFSKSVQQAAESAPGIGLGLAICQRFAKELGGRLMIENTERGARVTLALPISK